MSLLVLKKERMILKGSKILKDYDILQRFLEKTPNLKKRQLNELPKEQINFMKHIFPKVLKVAQNEWVVDYDSVEYVTGNHMKCELCGQRPIKKICIIENKFTKEKMRIGTECVTNFGLKNDIKMKKLIKDSKKTKLLEEVNKIYPGIERTINEWDYFIGEQEILIKKDIARDYLNYGEDAKRLLKEYTDIKTLVKRRKRILKELGIILENKNKEMDKIKEYVSTNRTHPLIPNRELVNRMKRSASWKTLDLLREDGIIRHRTLFRINDEAFSKSLVNKMNAEMKKINCRVNDVVGNSGVGYIYKYQNKNWIDLFCSHEKFFFEFYNFITGDEGESLNFEVLLKISQIYGHSSRESFLDELFSSSGNTRFRLDDIYHEYNDFYLFNREKKHYCKLDIRYILEKFKVDLFLEDKNIKQKVLREIENSSNKTISIDDYNHIKEIRYNS